jgi:hypothetical protein
MATAQELCLKVSVLNIEYSTTEEPRTFGNIKQKLIGKERYVLLASVLDFQLTRKKRVKLPK